MSAVSRRYFVRGRDFYKKGEWESALREFGAALELSPTFAEARVGFSLTLARTNPTRAAQELKSALDRTQRPVERVKLLGAYGDILLMLGNVGAAQAAFTEASQIDGTSPIIHDRAARLSAKTGKYQDAFQSLLAASRSKA